MYAPSMAAIICAGHAAFDLLVPLEVFPEENRKYHLEKTEESSGGPAANAASLLGRWGVQTALLAPLGDDAFGSLVRADLAADGVETALLRVDAGVPTPLSVIIAVSASGSRTILTRKPKRPPLDLTVESLNRFASEADVAGLVFDGHESEASMALMDRYPRAWSLLDAGTLRPGTELLARRVDYLIASEAFTRSVADREGIPLASGAAGGGAGQVDAEAQRGIPALRRLCGRWVGFTRGELGCVWQSTPATPIRAMPALAGSAIDTTAAGDIFHGAFAYGLLSEVSPDRALLYATAAAGLSVRRQGGRASIPSLEETRAVIEKGLVSIGND